MGGPPHGVKSRGWNRFAMYQCIGKHLVKPACNLTYFNIRDWSMVISLSHAVETIEPPYHVRLIRKLIAYVRHLIDAVLLALELNPNIIGHSLFTSVRFSSQFNSALYSNLVLLVIFLNLPGRAGVYITGDGPQTRT
jgi:hypothetical protein